MVDDLKMKNNNILEKTTNNSFYSWNKESLERIKSYKLNDFSVLLPPIVGKWIFPYSDENCSVSIVCYKQPSKFHNDEIFIRFWI